MLPDDSQRPEMTAEEFRLLSELVYEHCGILFREDQRYLLERRLWARVKAVGAADFMSYHRYLRFDAARKAELELAVEAVTTNETYFFREPMQLKSFAEELLPMVATERERRKRLRIWSAGCSTGEEAYTTGILILESGLFKGWEVEVFGSDISRKVLATARRAAYSRLALRDTPPGLAARYFQQEAGRYVVAEPVRAMVNFGHLNLLDDQMMCMVGRADVVFCRNVMIYFDLAARRRVLKSIYNKLSEGGYLLLGHSESLINVTADFELVHLKHDLIYRRPPGAP